jgi:hypothetical protein
MPWTTCPRSPSPLARTGARWALHSRPFWTTSRCRRVPATVRLLIISRQSKYNNRYRRKYSSEYTGAIQVTITRLFRQTCMSSTDFITVRVLAFLSGAPNYDPVSVALPTAALRPLTPGTTYFKDLVLPIVFPSSLSLSLYLTYFVYRAPRQRSWV